MKRNHLHPAIHRAQDAIGQTPADEWTLPRMADLAHASTRHGIDTIKTAKVLGFADLGMEAIYEFDVVDMPVTVAVDAAGTSVHNTGPAEWQKRIATGEFKGIAVSAG